MSILRRDADGRLGLLWRIAMVLVAASLVWLGIIEANRTFIGAGYDPLGHATSAVLTSVLIVPLVVLARRYLDRRPLAGIGLPPVGVGWRSFVLGMGCYLIPAGLGLAIVLVLGRVEIEVDAPITEVVALLAGLVVLVLLFEALPEELLFRGYVYHDLNTAVPRWAAVGGQAVLFALWGVAIGAAPTVDRIVFLASMALVIGLIRAISGDVWACIGFHLAFQTVQQFFGGSWMGDRITASPPGTLETIVLGLVPLVLAVAMLQLLVREETDWSGVEPDTIAADAPE